MKKLISFILTINLTLLSVLPVYAKPLTKYSQMEVRQFQSHVFDTKNEKMVYKAVINTLQDNGFIILNIEDEIGYIHARKDFKSRRIDKGRMVAYSMLLAYGITCTALSYGASAYMLEDPINKMNNEISPHTVIIDANANVESFGGKTRVRFVMTEKEFENADGDNFVKSAPRKAKRIYEPILYRAFFTEVDKNIFYEAI